MIWGPLTLEYFGNSIIINAEMNSGNGTEKRYYWINLPIFCTFWIILLDFDIYKLWFYFVIKEQLFYKP